MDLDLELEGCLSLHRHGIWARRGMDGMGYRKNKKKYLMRMAGTHPCTHTPPFMHRIDLHLTD